MVPKQPLLFCALALVLVLCLPLTARAQKFTSGSISGTVVDAETKEKLAGVTIIAGLAETELVAVSDGLGAFRFDALPPGDWQLLLIYADTAVTRQVAIMPGQELALMQELTLEGFGTGCVFLWNPEIKVDTVESGIRENFFSDTIKNTPPPKFSGAHFPTFLHQSPLEGLYLVSGLNNSGSPWVAHVNREFVEETSATRVGLGPESRSSLGAIHEITLKNGTNELAGSVLGQTAHTQNGGSYSLATHLGGPIKKDKAWFFVGGAAALTGQRETRYLSRQVLGRLDYAPSYEGSGQLTYLTTLHNRAHTDNIGAQWTEKFFDAKTKLSVGTALQQGVKLNRNDRRLSARLTWLQRIEALGYHELVTGARIDVNRLKMSGHALGTALEGRNVALFMQERWMVQPNITINTGLLYENFSVERALSSNASSRFEPRLGVAYDWTQEGRSKLFGSVARLHPGYRLTESEQGREGFADEAVVGGEYEFMEGFVVGGDYQGRRSLVRQYHLDAVTIHIFSGEPLWLPKLQFRASYSYAKTKDIEGTISPIGSHRFRLDGYYQWQVGDASNLYLGWSLRAANKGYRDTNLRIGFKRGISSDSAIDVFADVASTQLAGPASPLVETSENSRDGSKLQLSVRYSY